VSTFTYAALASEINTDPTALGYAPLVTLGSDAVLAALLNQRPGSFSPAKTWTTPAPLIPIATVLQWGATGPLAAIQAAQTSQIAGIPSIAIASILGFQSLATFDVSDARNLQSLAIFVQAGVLTQAQVNALLALGVAPASRAEVLFGIGTTVGLSEISKALRGI
jgi:hypothetical protein